MPIKTGDIVGMLTVGSRVDSRGRFGTFYRCHCKCGKQRIVRADKLVNMIVTDCGCQVVRRHSTAKMSRTDIKPPSIRGAKEAAKEVGNKYGRLLITKYLGTDRGGRRVYECLCDCGNTSFHGIYSLHIGATASCGCLHKDIVGKPKFTLEQRARHDLYCHYKSNARHRGLTMTLTEDSIYDLCTGTCHYCGAEPNNTRHVLRTKGKRVAIMKNGIDRVDSAKGYEDGNVVSCCQTCNVAKQSMSLSDFIAWVDKVYSHLHGSTGMTTTHGRNTRSGRMN